MPLLRQAIGTVLRRIRLAQGRTLRDAAAAADVSVPYLSEVELGRKELSSEVLAAVCGALAVTLDDLLDQVGAEVRRGEAAARRHRPPLTTGPAGRTDRSGPAGPAAAGSLSARHPDAAPRRLGRGGFCCQQISRQQNLLGIGFDVRQHDVRETSSDATNEKAGVHDRA
ncbi:helix-turn-helix domain-containing protein [Micromonospora sp. NPDC048830]|uniref:helix-turn-helix domain-containing protein n=1 Tax=Micromonospora sp. NPDC048830 TaxID=3364257 RepID=UPI003710BF52